MKNPFKFFYRKRISFLINYFYNESDNFERKNKLLRKTGIKIGDGTQICGPLHNKAKLIIGNHVFIGRNFNVEGNGQVIIEDNCNIGPNVTIITGSHLAGDSNRRAGEGFNCNVVIKKGSWICANVIISTNVVIGLGNIVAAGSVVIESTPDNVMVAGVPAQVKKTLIK